MPTQLSPHIRIVKILFVSRIGRQIYCNLTTTYDTLSIAQLTAHLFSHRVLPQGFLGRYIPSRYHFTIMLINKNKWAYCRLLIMESLIKHYPAHSVGFELHIKLRLRTFFFILFVLYALSSDHSIYFISVNIISYCVRLRVYI